MSTDQSPAESRAPSCSRLVGGDEPTLRGDERPEDLSLDAVMTAVEHWDDRGF